MSETYTTGLDGWLPITYLEELGQVFTPRETHTLEFIDLQIKPLLRWIPDNLEVYECDATGQPIDGCISHSERYTFQKDFIIIPQRVRFGMQNVLVEKDKHYLIVMRQGLPAPFWLWWGFDSSGQTYAPRGWLMKRPLGDTAWTPYYDQCFIFAEFGTPPLPQPEPPPPIEKFAAVDIAYTHYDIGLVIRIPTNVPCHLTCYYTNTEPRKHHKSRTIRGLKVPWGTYFCFVAWKEVEQTEAGDTLYHTFDFPDWKEGETRWFTFRGQVDLVDVPSVGPIFKHTHPGADPPLPPLRPNAPGDLAQCLQFPPGIGEHWDKVAEEVPDEDATYVHKWGGTLGYFDDAYNFTNLPDNVINIDSLTIHARVRRIAQNPGGTYPTKVGLGLRINGVNHYSTFSISSNTYVIPNKTFITNPSTGNKWTRDEINNLQSFLRLRFINMALWQGGLISARCTQMFIEVKEGIKGGPD